MTILRAIPDSWTGASYGTSASRMMGEGRADLPSLFAASLLSARFGCRFFLEELDGLLVAHAGCYRGELREVEGGVELYDLEEQACVHDQDHVRGAPLMVAYVGLLQDECAALVEFAQKAESIIDIVNALAFETGDALLSHIDPKLTRHPFQDLGFEIVGIEAGVGLKGEPVAGSVQSFDDTGKGVLKGVRQGSDDFACSVGVAAFPFLAVPLQAGIAEQLFESNRFFLLVFDAEGIAVDRDQAGHVPISGSDDPLGSGDTRAHLVQVILHGMAGVAGRIDLGFKNPFDECLGFFVGERRHADGSRG